jgi:alanine racemase
MLSQDHPFHGTRAEIDLGALRNNLAAVRSYVEPSVGIMAVIKADAYGHGAVRIAEGAVGLGVQCLSVARFHEGLKLREAGIAHPILILEALQKEHIAVCLANGFELTAVSRESAQLLSAAAGRAGRKAVVHAKVDTGMGRLGMSHLDAPALLESIAMMPGLELRGVYSHFATAEESDQTYAREQLARFLAVLEGLERKKIEIPLRHMANSAAILSLPESYFDMVRPGLMLYGYAPREDMAQKHPLLPVMALKSRVSFLKTVEAGSAISYGRKHIARKRTVIATVPVGYADGYFRSLTNRANVLINGERYPVVGTVCMDHVMVDVGLGSTVQEGDTVTLLGQDGAETITAWDLSREIGTVPYEITCAVSPRVPRVYLPDVARALGA